MLLELKQGNKVAGAKQAKRAVEAGSAIRVFLAADADPRVTQPLEELCTRHSVPVEKGLSMRELGDACGIAVGSAVAALVK